MRFSKRFKLIEPFSSFFSRSLDNQMQVIFFGPKPKSPAMSDQATCSDPTGEVSHDETALIDRARVVYQTLLYREQAARYGAAANSLLSAITQAQSGTPEALELLLRELSAHESLIRNCTIADEQPSPQPIPATAILVPSVIRTTANEINAINPTAKNVATEVVLSNGNSTQETTKAEAVVSKPTDKEPTKVGEAKGSSKAGDVAMPLPSKQQVPKDAVPSDAVPNDAVPKQPALKQPASNKSAPNKPALKQPAPKQPAPKQLVPKQPVHKQPILKQPAHKQPANKRGKGKLPIDFLASVGVHGIFLVILGAWYITVVMPTPTLSVVAGTVETEDVLIETPMESLSELETSAEEVTSIPTPQVSDVAMAEAGAMQLETSVEAGVQVGGVMGEAVRELASASAPGKRVVEGAEFFGAKATGNTFIYIVDASPSMRRDRAFDAAKEQIMQSLRSMKPKQRFNILFFGGAVQKLEITPGETLAGPVSATPENIEKAMQWLQNISIQTDGRVPVDAVREAMEMDPDGIFLLFDGDTKLDNWVHSVTELNRSDGFLSDGAPAVPIHVIHFFREEFQRTMQLLAMENRGTYRFIPRPSVGQTLSR
jgi:hypothetical protein